MSKKKLRFPVVYYTKTYSKERKMSEDTGLLTIDDVRKRFPDRKGAITQEIVDIFNASMNEAEFQGESLVNTAVTYEAVLQRNKVGIKEYLNAIKFCAYLVSMDDNFTEAYKRTFSDRKFVQDRLECGSTSNGYRELTSAASRYRKTKLVVDILTYSQMPFELMFTGYRYKAVDVLYSTMLTAKLDRDRINAAKELLAATKGPENMKIELDVGVRESSAVANLNAQLAEFANNSIKHLEASTTDLAKLGAMKAREEVIEAEYE